MIPVMLFACCIFAVLLVPVLLFLFTAVFRHACVLCGLPKPSVSTASGVMMLIWVSKTLSEAVMNVIVQESCRSVGVPRWEADIIVIFLLIPIDLLISASLHTGLMNIRFGKGVEVWFVMQLIYLTILIPVGLVFGTLYIFAN